MAVKLKLKSKLKSIITLLVILLLVGTTYAQQLNIKYKNYDAGELVVPAEFDLQNFNPYPYDRYLISTDTFGEFKPIENESKLYEFFLDIDMINGWGIFGQSSLDISNEEYFKMFPKDSHKAILKKYPVSEDFNTYLLKLIYNPPEKDVGFGSIEQLFIININGEYISNISLLSVTSKDGFGGSQDYTINMGSYFSYTSEELYSDTISLKDTRIFDKPLFQKFKFDENGRLEIIME